MTAEQQHQLKTDPCALLVPHWSMKRPERVLLGHSHRYGELIDAHILRCAKCRDNTAALQLFDQEFLCDGKTAAILYTDKWEYPCYYDEQADLIYSRHLSDHTQAHKDEDTLTNAYISSTFVTEYGTLEEKGEFYKVSDDLDNHPEDHYAFCAYVQTSERVFLDILERLRRDGVWHCDYDV